MEREREATFQATPRPHPLGHSHLLHLPLFGELVVRDQFLPPPARDVFLGHIGGEVDAVVEVSTPEHIVMRLQSLTLEWNRDLRYGMEPVSRYILSPYILSRGGGG